MLKLAQHIAQEVLPAMQNALGASNVMQEAALSEPNIGHFDPNNCIQAAPLVDLPANTATPAQTITPDITGV